MLESELKNEKCKSKNEEGAGGMEAGETPMFAGRKAGSAVSPGSSEMAVSGVGSRPRAEGEKGEIGEKAPFNADGGSRSAESAQEKAEGNLDAIGDLKFEISEQEKNEDGSKAKHQMEEREGPLPGPLPTPRTCGEGDNRAAMCSTGNERDSAAGSCGDGGSGAGEAGIGNMKFQISKEEKGDFDHFPQQEGQIVQLCSPLPAILKNFSRRAAQLPNIQ